VNNKPGFVSGIGKRASASIVNADGTNKKLLFIAPKEGAIIDELVGFSTDTADQLIELFESPNPTAGSPTYIKCDQVKIPLSSGGATAAASYVKPYDMLQGDQWRLDQAGSKRTRIAGGCGLYVAAAAAITAAKTITVTCAWSPIRK
jgi:hypothetical protein